jgi:DNA modification methylase
MVAVFREVKRVLRKDGTCWLNIGDSYANTKVGNTNEAPDKKPRPYFEDGTHTMQFRKEIQAGMKPKDMMLIPQRLALALQADGWWVRSDIIWAKPNPMPESVTDRPTKSHEYIWLLSKSKDYFWDQEAVREPNEPGTLIRYKPGERIPNHRKFGGSDRCTPEFLDGQIFQNNGRNLRTVWNIATQPYSGAHYATYPEELVLRCLKAATSERGCCPKCGRQFERVTENKTHFEGGSGKAGRTAEEINSTGKWAGIQYGTNLKLGPVVDTTTLGFRPGCACDLPPIPATILDPFCGSGTTLLVAKRMGLNAIGLDLSYQYLRENAWERVGMNAPVMKGI